MYAVDSKTDELTSHGRQLYYLALQSWGDASQEKPYARLSTDNATKIFGMLSAAAGILEEELADEQSEKMMNQSLVLFKEPILKHMEILRDCYAKINDFWLNYPFTNEKSIESLVSTAGTRERELREAIGHFGYVSMQ